MVHRIKEKGAMNHFEIVTPREAAALAASGNYIVIDLREKEEYEKGHLEHALSMPDAKVNEIERLNLKNELWLLYCSRGNLSFRLASKLARMGYQVWAVGGTIDGNFS